MDKRDPAVIISQPNSHQLRVPYNDGPPGGSYSQATAGRTLAIHAFPYFPASLEVPPGCRLARDVLDADLTIAVERPLAAAERAQMSSRPLMPLLAFTQEAPPWYDYRGSEALSQGLAVATGIIDRLAELKLAEHPSMGDLLLARLYSRQTEMTAHHDPSLKDVIGYPSAGPIYGALECANQLVEQSFLSHKFFDRTYICGQCHGARLLAREECVECRSTSLKEQALVHHFRCGHEAPVSAFKRGGNRFDCPKCNRELRHIGLDYDKPGSVVVCGNCAAVNDTAAVGFLCADCLHHQDAETLAHRDWYNYQLTPAAVRLLRSGHTTGSYAGRIRDDLRVLVEQACLHKEEFGQEFSLLRVHFKAARRIRASSPRIWEQSHALSVDAARSAVRRIDRIGQAHDGLMVYLAEIDSREAAKAIQAIRERLDEVVEQDLEPEFTLLGDAAIQEWLHPA